MISRKPSLTPVTDSVSSEQYRRKYTVPRLYLGCTCRLYLGCDSLGTPLLHRQCLLPGSPPRSSGNDGRVTGVRFAGGPRAAARASPPARGGLSALRLGGAICCHWQPASRGISLSALGPMSATMPLQISGSEPEAHKTSTQSHTKQSLTKPGGAQFSGWADARLWAGTPEARGVFSRTAAVLLRRASDERCITSILWSCIEMYRAQGNR